MNDRETEIARGSWPVRVLLETLRLIEQSVNATEAGKLVRVLQFGAPSSDSLWIVYHADWPVGSLGPLGIYASRDDLVKQGFDPADDPDAVAFRLAFVGIGEPQGVENVGPDRDGVRWLAFRAD